MYTPEQVCLIVLTYSSSESAVLGLILTVGSQKAMEYSITNSGISTEIPVPYIMITV